MNNIVVFLLVALISSTAFSIQTYSVSDGDSIQIKVSSKDLTRIRMDSGRLDGAWGLDENFTHKADRSKGEIFVRPKPGAPTTSSFFIKDGNGSVYSVTAVQHAIPSDTVVLKSLDYTAKRDSSQSSRKASSDVKRIKRLVK
ncbi:TraK domain-containing protein, partial [Bermanella marisrubri]